MDRSVMCLGDLCDLVTEQVNPVDHPGAIYVGLEHVESGRFVRRGEGKASEVRSAKYAFASGDILYGKLRPYLDKAVLAQEEGLCTTELLVLRPKEGVDPRFIVGLVHAPTFVRHAVAGTTGVQHPRTSWNHIRDFHVPATSREEQEKTAKLLWQVHDAITANAAVIKTATALKRGAMCALFTHGLRGEAHKETEIGPVPMSWAVTALGEVALLERGRFMHRPRNEPRFYGGSTPFVQTGDVVRSGGKIREFTQTLSDDGVAISRVFPKGTILITIAANIGFTGILKFSSACPDSLVAITPIQSINIEYLEYFLQTQQREMARLAPKGTQKNINIQFLIPWPIAIPSLDEQGEIAAILNVIDQKIDLHRKKCIMLDDLFKIILHKLMTSEVKVSDVDLSTMCESRHLSLLHKL